MPRPQLTMRFTLISIGTHFAEHRARLFGEKLGIYRDDQVSKGSNPPFVPIAIKERVSRQDGTPSQRPDLSGNDGPRRFAVGRVEPR